MSHPCGNYNLETLKILSDPKIKIDLDQMLISLILNQI